MQELLLFMEEMFRDLGLISLFKIEEEKLHSFLIEVRHGYSKKNPYHNFRSVILLVLSHREALALTSYSGMHSMSHTAAI